MGHLPQRMNARIGAACAIHFHIRATKTLEARFQHMLHGQAICLRLPADERCAIIFDGEFVAGHQATLSPMASGYPRRKSRALIADLPARCSSEISSAPSPQAMMIEPSAEIISPGFPDFATGIARNIFMRVTVLPVPASKKAPGKGVSPRIWQSISEAGRD